VQSLPSLTSPQRDAAVLWLARHDTASPAKVGQTPFRFAQRILADRPGRLITAPDGLAIVAALLAR